MENKQTYGRSMLGEIGMVSPQAVQAEEFVLGSLLVEGTKAHLVVNELKADDFYKDQNQRIFSAILRLFRDGSPITTLTITHELKKTNDLEVVGGIFYLTTLTTPIVIVRDNELEYAIKVIRQKSMGRSIIQVCDKAIKGAYNDEIPIDEVLNEAANSIMDISLSGSLKKSKPIGLLSKTKLIEVMKIRAGEIHDSTILTHLKDFNEMMGGIAPSDLIILAARPGMGKTALLTSLCFELAVTGVKVGIFTLEMSEYQITDRLLSVASRVSHFLVRKPKHMVEEDFEKFARTVDSFQELPIIIDDTPALPIVDFRSKANRMVYVEGVRIIFVDYIQLMRGSATSKGNRENEISEISRGLKQVAKTLNVPIIALSQLNRDVEKRPSKRPQLSDLRESGSIEQDADQVLLLFRPAYYNIFEHDNHSYVEMKKMTELIVAKNRHGETGAVELQFNADRMYFSDFVTEPVTFKGYTAVHPNSHNEDPPF